MIFSSVVKKAVLVAVPLALAASAGAQTITRLDAEHVAVRAAGVPVGRVLGELNGIHALDNLFIEPAIETKVVSVSIDRVKVGDAAVQILKDSGLDFIVWGNRVFVGDPTAAVALAKLASGSPAEAQSRESAVEVANDAPVTDPQASGHDTLTTDEYSMVGESVTYHDPNFVTYKMRPEVVKRRMSVDVSTIP